MYIIQIAFEYLFYFSCVSFVPVLLLKKKKCLYSGETENIIDYCPQLSDGQNDTVDFG